MHRPALLVDDTGMHVSVLALFSLLLFVRSQARRVELHPSQPDASAQRLQVRASDVPLVGRLTPYSLAECAR